MHGLNKECLDLLVVKYVVAVLGRFGLRGVGTGTNQGHGMVAVDDQETDLTLRLEEKCPAVHHPFTVRCVLFQLQSCLRPPGDFVHEVGPHGWVEFTRKIFCDVHVP